MARTKNNTPKKKSKASKELPPEAKPPCKLYLITPPVITDLEAYGRALEAALLAGPVACLQIRLKSHDGTPAPDSEIIQAASLIVPIAHKHGVAVLINDRPDLVGPCGADGVHIGQSDMDYLSSRELLGADAIIGVTCHNSRDLAFDAANDGADYVAFGAFFDTPTKQAAFKAELELLTWWNAFIEVPCVAIGGITPENCAPLIEAGADFIAVSSGVWNYKDGPAAAIKVFLEQV